jgi:hypothetical protein
MNRSRKALGCLIPGGLIRVVLSPICVAIDDCRLFYSERRLCHANMLLNGCAQVPGKSPQLLFAFLRELLATKLSNPRTQFIDPAFG